MPCKLHTHGKPTVTLLPKISSSSQNHFDMYGIVILIMIIRIIIPYISLSTQ